MSLRSENSRNVITGYKQVVNVNYWGGPLWRPWNPLRFWRLALGPSMDKIFARVVIRLAASHCS